MTSNTQAGALEDVKYVLIMAAKHLRIIGLGDQVPTEFSGVKYVSESKNRSWVQPLMCLNSRLMTRKLEGFCPHVPMAVPVLHQDYEDLRMTRVYFHYNYYNLKAMNL